MKKYTVPLFAAIFFTIMFLYPVLFHFTTHLTSRADGVFISWTIYTVSTLLAEGKNIFDLPIYFPFANTLTYSDPFIPTAILTIPLLFFTKNIVAIHNFHLIFGAVLLYVSSYFIGKQLKFSNLASHFLAFFFTFSSIQTQYLVHLHTYLLAGIPLTLLFFLKWIENNQWYWLFFSLCVFILQTLNSPMSGFFVFFACIPFLLQKTTLTQIKKNMFMVSYYIFFACVVLALFFTPYFLTSQQFKYTRTIRDAAHFAFSLDRLFQPDLLLSFSLLFLLWKTTKKTKKKTAGNLTIFTSATALFVACIGVVLMLGPVIKIHDETFKIFGIPIPLPYTILYYLVPGFKAFRASSRFIVLLNFGIALLFGNFVSESKLKQKFLYLLFGVLISTQFYFHFAQFELYQIPTEIPKIYDLVKEQKKSTILAEFPVFSWRMMPFAYLENDRLLYQTYHGKILYNGVSGFTPPERESQWDLLWQEFPSEETIVLLKNAGVTLVLIHYDLYDEMYEKNFTYAAHTSKNSHELKQNIGTRLDLIDCKQNACIYSIR